MSPVVSIRPLLLALGVLAAALVFGLLASDDSGAAPAGKPRLVVTAVSSPPPVVAAGGTFPVDGKVQNRGKRANQPNAGATVRLLLRGGAIDRRKIGTAPLGRVTAGGKRRFSSSVRIPDSFAPAAGRRLSDPYELLACVPNQGGDGSLRCKVAKGSLSVAGTGATPTPTEPPGPVTEPPGPVTEPPPAPGPGPRFTVGSRTLGDPLFPQIGNGGYDAQNYAIEIDYEPSTNTLLAGTRTTIEARATQNLSEFSLDFQRDLTVSAVTVDGVAAGFAQVDATPEFAPGTPAATQPGKLVISPASGILSGSDFEVDVSYSGVPVEIVDADTSLEGWVRACVQPDTEVGCDGSFTVNEPIGAQSWYPSNNYPSDKATIDTEITVPATHITIGTGELASRAPNGDGTETWSWSEDDPTSTYLASATVGLFDYATSTFSETSTDITLTSYEAIDSRKLPLAKTTFGSRVGLIPSTTNFFSQRFGPYPFDSTGAVADIAPNLGYALENQTKPHYAGDTTNAYSASTQAHEIAHQWLGDSVGPATWEEIWFNEGWATFAQELYDNNAGEAAMQAYFDTVYDRPTNDWSTPPANLPGPEALFSFFPVYERPSAMLEGFREIIGDAAFYGFAEGLTSTHAYGSISIDQFIAEAKAASGLSGPDLQRLDEYFQQWLLGTTKPTLTPDSFP